jgi:acetoin utilization deacetylase AcuC-like enzyme
MAAAGEPAFALITPPSHHAGPDSYIGYCYLNNVAVAIRKLIDENKVQTALVIDFDFHFGEGTADISHDDERIAYFWLPVEGNRAQQLAALEGYLTQASDYDILAVSAGFDRAREERGGVFETGDYTTIGRLLKEAAERNCQGRRFAALEGGYNLQVLGKNVKAFLQGFQ